MVGLLTYWNSRCFKAFGSYFGGLVSCSSQTLNFLDCSSASNEVKKNSSGFLPTELKSKISLHNFFTRIKDDAGFYFSQASSSPYRI